MDDLDRIKQLSEAPFTGISKLTKAKRVAKMSIQDSISTLEALIDGKRVTDDLAISKMQQLITELQNNLEYLKNL